MTLLKLAAITGLVLLAGLGLIFFETATTTFTSGTAARPITDHRPSACGPAPTAEPFYVEPVTSPTTQLTQTLNVRLGNGSAITITGGTATVAVTGTFTSNTPVAVTVPLWPNATQQLAVSGQVEYATGCYYTLNTTRDRYGNLLTIVQVSRTTYLPIILHDYTAPGASRSFP
jgi:hypothetical protein